MTFNELRDKLFQNYTVGAISDEQLVQIIELASGYLNLRTLTDYAKKERISYNGAKKRAKHTCDVGGVSFIVSSD